MEPEVKIITWDWKQEAPLSRIAEAVLDVSGGTVHLREVEDTGGDMYAVTISDRRLTDAEQETALRQDRT